MVEPADSIGRSGSFKRCPGQCAMGETLSFNYDFLQ